MFPRFLYNELIYNKLNVMNKDFETLSKQIFKKIPIIIYKWSEDGVDGWRAEIADNYENYKTAKYEDINFEDLSFHFRHNIETHAKDHLVFYRRKDATECARYINKKELGGKGKIWFI